jgi:hypothetical protein
LPSARNPADKAEVGDVNPSFSKPLGEKFPAPVIMLSFVGVVTGDFPLWNFEKRPFSADARLSTELRPFVVGVYTP